MLKMTMPIAALGLLALAATPALADPATGDQIKAAITGNTVQGSMDSSGAYTEFYAEDGTAWGKDYKAVWSVEGDTMCWVYDGSPKDCWNVEIAGDQVKWVKEGKAQGTGTIVKGNPNNFGTQ